MLLSLVRIIFFFTIIVVLSFVASHLIESGSEVKLSFNGEEYRFTAIVGLIGLVSLIIAAWLASKIFGFFIAVFKFFNGSETAISRYFIRNRERKGFESLADGMVALAAGEGKTALKKAAKAE